MNNPLTLSDPTGFEDKDEDEDAIDEERGENQTISGDGDGGGGGARLCCVTVHVDIHVPGSRIIRDVPVSLSFHEITEEIEVGGGTWSTPLLEVYVGDWQTETYHLGQYNPDLGRFWDSDNPVFSRYDFEEVSESLTPIFGGFGANVSLAATQQLEGAAIDAGLILAGGPITSAGIKGLAWGLRVMRGANAARSVAGANRAFWVGANGEAAAVASGSKVLQPSKAAVEAAARGDWSVMRAESAAFARGATGDVKVFYGDGKGRIFRNDELPELLRSLETGQVSVIEITF